MEVMTATVDLHEIRARVGDVLNQLSADLVKRPNDHALQARVAKLGQIAAGLAVVDPECLPRVGAGYGSTVEVRDIDSGDVGEYTLMVGMLVDLDANQVSLASPMGQALLGASAGDQVTLTTPGKQVSLLVTRVATLFDHLDRPSTNGTRPHASGADA